MSIDDIRSLLPQDRTDDARVKAIIALGYPTVVPIVPDLLKWLQDYNWPIAKAIAPFLVTIGVPLVPNLRDILMTADDEWKFWIMTKIIAKSPEIAQGLQDELERIATNPTASERSSDLDNVAQEILHQ